MTEDRYASLIKKALGEGAEEVKLIDTNQVVFDPQSYLQCRFGCNWWGKFWTCPPNLDTSVKKFMQAFARYHKAIVIQTKDPQTAQEAAVAVEREALLSHGCRYAFALALCVQCESCAHPDPCLFPHLAQPPMDAYGIDVCKTVERLSFPMEFDSEGKLLPAWYTMVLVD